MSATRFGDAWVATIYIVRHLKQGYLWQCLYAEPPPETELREVCGDEDVDRGLVRVEATALVTTDAIRALALGRLDEWHPPPLPEGTPQFVKTNPLNEAEFRVEISGVGVVKNP